MNGPGKESMKRKYKIAMVQMDTQNNKEKNLEDACAWIDEAAASGAELVCFPEVMNLIGKNTGPGGGSTGRAASGNGGGPSESQYRHAGGASGAAAGRRDAG